MSNLTVAPIVGAWIETNDIIRANNHKIYSLSKIDLQRELVKVVEGRCLPSLFFLSQCLIDGSAIKTHQ